MRNIAIAGLLALAYVFVTSVGGRLEGVVHPVVTRAEISDIDPLDDAWVRIWGQSRRLRDCAFVRLEWRIGNRDTYTVVDHIFEEASKVRAAGDFRFGPWRLHLTEGQLRSLSYALVYHRCHPLWDTETVFFDREGD